MAAFSSNSFFPAPSCRLTEFVENGIKQTVGYCRGFDHGTHIIEVVYDTTGEFILPVSQRTPEWKRAMSEVLSPPVVSEEGRARRMFGNYYSVFMYLNDFQGLTAHTQADGTGRATAATNTVNFLCWRSHRGQQQCLQLASAFHLMEKKIVRSDFRLGEAFRTLEDNYASAWRATVIDDVAGRAKLFLAINVVGKDRDHLGTIVANGKLAQAELS